MMTSLAPTVISLWRYPVKSMMGEELNAATVTLSGVFGDRAHAVVDRETGKIVSAKNPRRWPDFFAFRATYSEPPLLGAELPTVWIELPDGEAVRGDSPDLASRLTEALGREVTFQYRAPVGASLEQYWPEREGQSNAVSDEAISGAAPAGSFFDYATIHVLTTATLDKLRQLYPQGRFEVRRFRPNLVVQTASGLADFVENAWVGKTLRFGDEVELLVTDPCPRCVMTTLPQGDLPNDPDILRAITGNTVEVPFAQKALPCVGVYAKVVRTGIVRRGDPVTVVA